MSPSAPSSLYDTATALRELGVTDNTLSADEKRFLDENGFLPLIGLLSPGQIEAVGARLDELLAIEKEDAGKEVHQEAGTARLSNLIDKGEVFRVFFSHPRVLAALARVLNGNMKLSSLNSRAALPGEGLQMLHVDWSGPIAPGDYMVCNSIWLLDDFTPDNGATRVVPGSHRWNQTPRHAMPDPKAPHPQEQLLLAPAGTVVVFNAHTWHGGTLNRSKAPRRALHSYWTRRDQEQQLNQEKFLSTATKRSLTPALRYLLDVTD